MARPPLQFAVTQGECGFCAGPLDGEASVVPLGDLAFHASCAPCCHACGRALERDLEVGWSHQELIVSSPSGYDRLPCHHLCAACRDTTLHAEPCAQD